MDETQEQEPQEGLTETVGEPEQVQAETFDVQAYVGDFFYVCIVIGAILPAGGVILAGIVRAALLAMGLKDE